MEGAAEGGAPADAAPAEVEAPTAEPGEMEAFEHDGSSPAPETEAPTRTLKVDGKEITVTEEEYHALAQKGSSADKRFRDNSEATKILRREQQTLRNIGQALQDDPFAVGIQLMGEEQFWARMKERYDYAQLPPAERKRLDDQRQTKTKAQLYDERQRQDAEQRRAEGYTAAVTQQRGVGEAGILAVLKENGITVSDWSVGRMAYLSGAYCRENNVGAEDVPYGELVKDVSKKMRSDRTSHYEKLDTDEALLADLEDLGVLDRIRKALVARFKKGQAPGKTNGSAPIQRRKAPPAAPSSEDFFDTLRNRGQ